MTATHRNYRKAVQAYIANDNRVLNAYLKSDDASMAEKSLIRARLAIKLGNYDDAAKYLRGLNSNSSLLLGEKHFVRANIHSYKSEWQEAICEAQLAFQHYQSVKDQRGQFLSGYNLSVYYNRVGLDAVSYFYINESKKNAVGPAQISLVHRALSCHYSLQSKFDEALSSIESAIQNRSELDDVDRAALDSVAADIYFRTGHYEAAISYLESLAYSKVIRDKARVRFDLAVLRSITQGKNRFVEGTPSSYISSNLEYRLRWLILSSLQDGDWTQAKQRWGKLSSLLPQRFASDFKCVSASDEKTIFMTAVTSLLKSRLQPSRKTPANLKGKLRKLFEILDSAPIALRKEELIEKVWDVPYRPEFDNRFYKLVERLRKETTLPIENVSHTYRFTS